MEKPARDRVWHVADILTDLFRFDVVFKECILSNSEN